MIPKMTIESASSTASSHPDEEDDDPKLSSAALCISLQMVGTTFRPEFTHQCFEEEWIRGYQPFAEVIRQEKKIITATKDNKNYSDVTLLHKSHQYHKEGSTRELKIQVDLAPSGQNCFVQVQVRKKRDHNAAVVHHQHKRPRIEPTTMVTRSSGGDARCSATESTEDDEDDDYEPLEDSESEEYQVITSGMDTPAGPTRRRRMPLKDILESIKKALPPMVLQKKEQEKIGGDYLAKPVGIVLEEYRHRQMDFVTCFAHGTQVVEFHHRVQRLALWFIENASDVNLALNGNHWNILYLLRKHRMNKRVKYSLVGYLTIFYFSAPFRKPRPGIVARICQVLILPPYQRSGHGKRLLHCVHDLAHGKYDDQIVNSEDEDDGLNIVEINVEDPAPGFVALRNLVDYERLVQSKQDGQPWLPQFNRDPTRVSRTTFAPLTDDQVHRAANAAKITPLQIQICFEIYQLQVFHEILTTDPGQRDELEKSYRLMVKKRLNKTYRDEFGKSWSKKDMQHRLSELFDQVFRQYHAILGIPMK